ncbi:MAG: carboxymuconolactone decarboxylase family protein [bacterium]
MSFLKSLPQDAVLPDMFKKFPQTAKPLLEYHEALMRGSSPFSVAERELIAAYISGLNACSYCQGVHAAVAEKFGVSEGLLAALIEKVDEGNVDEKMKPVLAYVQKLTVTPSKMTQHDADAFFAAGWDETALHDAVSVCALFNFMNRLVEGIGIRADATYFSRSSERLSKHGYIGLVKMLSTE